MCKCASFVITKGPKVWWCKLSDSHEEIISEHKLNADGVGGPNIVRVEIVPPNGDLSLPLRQWKYGLDQPDTPEWYDAVEAEKACWCELMAWQSQKLTGWKVKEAFHPVNPLKLQAKEISQEELLMLLKSWASVRDSVGALVEASVRASVGASVGASVWASVGASVRASVRDSVWDSVWAYVGGLFPNLIRWKFAEKLGPDPWRPLLTLWYAGYLPSFDSTTWRLHAGPDAKIVLEWTPERK